MKRGRYLVNIIEEKDKEINAMPNIPTPSKTQGDTLEKSSVVISSEDTHAALSVVEEPIPCTSKQRISGNNYYISPIRSDESDIDDSDDDPNFQLVHKSNIPSNVVAPHRSTSSSSTSSNSSSSSSSSSSTSNSSSDAENDPQNVMVPENNSTDPEKKIVKKEHANLRNGDQKSLNC